MRYLDQIKNERFDFVNADPGVSREHTIPLPTNRKELHEWCALVKQRAAENKALRERYIRIGLHCLFMNEAHYVALTKRIDERGRPMHPFIYQKLPLLDNVVLGMCGRDVGKSMIMKWSIEHRCVNYPRSSMILTGAYDWRVDKPWGELTQREWPQNYLVRHFIDNSEGAGKQRLPAHQYFLNDFKLYGIAAGIESFRNVRSPHVFSVCGDEWQEFLHEAWKALSPAIFPYQANVQYGSMRKFFGVNEDGATDNLFYRMAHEDVLYSPHRYTFPSWYNPEYNLEKHVENLADFGPQVESDRFKQTIRGLVGERTQNLISQQDYNFCVRLGDRAGLNKRRFIRVDRQIWNKFGGDPRTIFDNYGLEDYVDTQELKVLSMDYGSSNPSEIGIWVKIINPSAADEENYELWLLWQRIQLHGVAPHDQAAAVHYLNGFYNLDYLAIDSTAATNVIAQILTDYRHTHYAHEGYDFKIFQALSNRYTPIRYELDEPRDANSPFRGMRWVKEKLTTVDGWPQQVWSLQQHTHILASNLVANFIERHKFGFSPHDTDFRAELFSVVEKTQEGGVPHYHGSFGLHRFSMVRSLMLWYHDHYIIKQLQREILGEEEEEEARFGSTYSSFRRIKSSTALHRNKDGYRIA